MPASVTHFSGEIRTRMGATLATAGNHKGTRQLLDQ